MRKLKPPDWLPWRQASFRLLSLERDSFDAPICRLALMLIPERHKALTAIHRALKAGARFAAIVLSTAEKEPHISESLAIARRHLGLPPAPFEDPGMFSLIRSRNGRISGSEFRLCSMAAATEAKRWELGTISTATSRKPERSKALRSTVWKEIETVIRRFEQSDGTVIIPTERFVAVGTK